MQLVGMKPNGNIEHITCELSGKLLSALKLEDKAWELQEEDILELAREYNIADKYTDVFFLGSTYQDLYHLNDPDLDITIKLVGNGGPLEGPTALSKIYEMSDQIVDSYDLGEYIVFIHNDGSLSTLNFIPNNMYSYEYIKYHTKICMERIALYNKRGETKND